MKNFLNNEQRQILENFIIKVVNTLEPVAQIIEYCELLMSKNEELNLISRQLKISDIINDHIFDCVYPVEFFLKYNSITDLGSGSGLPGMLLAIIFPQKKIVLIEKSPKKFNFLKSTVKQLNIKNTEIINELVDEQIIKTEAVTCRAFKDINTILTMTKNFYSNNGTYILYKARIEKINEELSTAKEKFKFNYEINKIEQIKDKERHIVIITKK